jgi:hypothetical protein
MCNPCSMIVRKNDVLWSRLHDSHTEIRAEFSVPEETDASGRFIKAVAVEITPPDDDWNAPLDQWCFKVDQDLLPDWWDAADAERHVREVLPDWVAACLVRRGERRECAEGDSLIVADGGHVEPVRGTIRQMSGNATVSDVYDNATVSDVRDNATVRDVYGNARVRDVYGDARVRDVYGNATVSGVYGNATVRDVYDNATVSDVYGNATVSDVRDNATVSDVYGNATVSDVYGNATVRGVRDNATVRGVYDNATVRGVRGNATVISYIPLDHTEILKSANAVLIDRSVSPLVGHRGI